MGKPTDRSDSRGFGFGEFRPGGAGAGVVWCGWCVVDGVWWSLVEFDGVWWSLVGV